jgi:hypothetical protein
MNDALKEALSSFSIAVKDDKISNKWKSLCGEAGSIILSSASFASSISEAYYACLNLLDGRPTCAVCTNSVSFHGLKGGYAKFCSVSCAAKSGNGLKNAEVHHMKNPVVSKKRSDTYERRHGGVGFAGRAGAKAKNSMLEKYGVDHNWRARELKEKYIEQRRVDFFNELASASEKWPVLPKFDEEAYKNIHDEYPWECKTCGENFTSSLIKGLMPRCPVCFPPLGGTSALEQMWFNKIKAMYSDAKSRVRVNGVEVDVLVGNVAIEINGIYWHSEIAGKDRNYHLNKTNVLAAAGIKLLHFFEDDLLNKPEIVESIIASKLGLTKKVYARKCSSVELTTREANEFFSKNHLAGGVTGINAAIGLLYEGELVLAVAIGKSRYSKDEFELLRFATKVNTTVVGGLSKAIKSAADYETIHTYVDRAISDGSGYLRAGWTKVGESGPAYHYFSSKEPWKHNRVQFQKHKLKYKIKEFDESLTEWENMQRAGWNRVWDCGTIKLIFKRNKT